MYVIIPIFVKTLKLLVSNIQNLKNTQFMAAKLNWFTVSLHNAFKVFIHFIHLLLHLLPPVLVF